MPEQFEFEYGGYTPATADDWDRAANFWLAESKSYAAASDPEYKQLCDKQAIACAHKSGELMVAELMLVSDLIGLARAQGV